MRSMQVGIEAGVAPGIMSRTDREWLRQVFPWTWETTTYTDAHCKWIYPGKTVRTLSPMVAMLSHPLAASSSRGEVTGRPTHFSEARNPGLF